MKFSKASIYFWLSMVFALWFALTGAVWMYFANVIISFPFLILSYLLWRNGTRYEPQSRRFKIIPMVWIVGTIVSLGVLVGLLLTN